MDFGDALLLLLSCAIRVGRDALRGCYRRLLGANPSPGLAAGRAALACRSPGRIPPEPACSGL